MSSAVAWLLLITAAVLWPLAFIAQQDDLDDLDRHWDDVQGLFE